MTAFLPVLFASETKDAELIGSGSPLDVRISVWAHLGLAILIVGGSLVLTARIHPYSYKRATPRAEHILSHICRARPRPPS